MSDERQSFNILFSIPQIDSAFMRNPAGGGRLKIDFDQSTVDQVNAMIDEAVKRGGVSFAGVVVMVEQGEPATPKIRSWKDRKLKS